MANALYPKWKEALLSGGTDTALSGTVKVMLIDSSDYGYSITDQYLSDVIADARVATATLANKTFVDGVFDADDATFATVTGDPSEALIIYIDTGVESTSRLVAYLDTDINGMPVTPNSGDIIITWDSGNNKIFGL